MTASKGKLEGNIRCEGVNDPDFCIFSIINSPDDVLINDATFTVISKSAQMH
jgi:hypothetical protein